MLGFLPPRNLPIYLLLVFATLVFGCSTDWPEETGTAVVEGTVVLDGSPVDRGYVVLIPENLQTPNDEIMPMAYGLTDATGNFELAYSDGNRQLLAGKYSVIISKSTLETADVEPAWSTALLPESVANLKSFNKGGELIPAIYNVNSTLVIEIKPSQETLRQEFELSSKDPLLSGSLMDDFGEPDND